MTTYEQFEDQRLANLAGAWLENGLIDVQIVMGPLSVVGVPDIYSSTIRIITAEVGQVVPGTLNWFDIRYIVFRAIYGFLRMLGLMNWGWELPNEYIDFDIMLYDTIVRPFRPHLRVKYPLLINNPLCVENMWSHSYMKVYPFFYQTTASEIYPSGGTTQWVDRFLHKDPNFNADLVTSLDEEGEGFVA